MYPLIKRCFPNLGIFPYGLGESAIYAYELEAALDKAVKVKAYTGPSSRPGGMWILEGRHDADSDMQALLIGIEPIVKESDEIEVLRQCLEFVSEQITNQSNSHSDMHSLFRRLRKLLESK